MSELDDFKATYFDECAELLATLEEEFIEIEEGDRSSDRLNAVFRAIHSIKGGAGAFGFDKLVEFAHSFETLLDYVRNDQVELTDEVAQLCIRSNDIVADFVNAARDGEDLPSEHGQEELARFNALCADEDEEPLEEFDIEFEPVMVEIGGDDADEPLAEASLSEESTSIEAKVEDSQPALGGGLELVEVDPEAELDLDFSAEQAKQDAAQRYRIRFFPHTELYQRANDPILLLRELAELGKMELEVELQTLPNLSEFDQFSSYCTWVIDIAPREGVGEAELAEVFEFVEGDCDLDISLVSDAAVAKTEALAPAPAIDLDDAAELGEFDPDSEDALADPAENSDEAPAAISSDDEFDVSPAQSVAQEGGLSFADLAAEIEPAVVAKPEPAPKAEASKPAEGKANDKKKEQNKSAGSQTIRVDLEKVDRVVNMVGELVIAQSMLNQQMDDHLKARYQELVRGVEVLAQTTRGLQDSVMAIRAQPVKSVFSRLPRLVRELASKTGKKMKLEMVGEHTEIDKTIIEQLSDPLTHMIRNSADHGLESVEDRVAAGKPETGTIQLLAEQSGGNIIIAVQDDGAGVNRERVLGLARERGVVGPDQQLSDEQIDELIFAPGFSTADEVSDISGRGVGMDVVISNIKKIGGSVHVKSWPGQGTRVQLRLPLTLAVLDVMLVRVGQASYVIPLSSIVETMQTRRAEFGVAPSGRRILRVRDEYVQVVDLASNFGMETDAEEDERFVVLCDNDGRGHIALVVDAIIGQQQVVIKSLEENFERIPGIAGGTILGDGSVALIVDVQGLNIQSDHKSAA